MLWLLLAIINNDLLTLPSAVSVEAAVILFV